MPRKKQTEDGVDKNPQDYTPERESLRKRVRKHIGDKNDKITDQDIRNVRVDALPDDELEASTGEIIPDNLEDSASKDEPGKGTDGNPKHVTPWDVVSD